MMTKNRKLVSHVTYLQIALAIVHLINTASCDDELGEFANLCERRSDDPSDVPYSYRKRPRALPQDTLSSRDSQQLYCEYLSGYLRKGTLQHYQPLIGRYKTEYLSLSKPEVTFFHDLISEREVEVLKHVSTPQVSSNLPFQ